MTESTSGKTNARILGLALFGMYATPALAYLDPGTGSMLLQGLIGIVAAAALTLKLYWHKFKALFRSKSTAERPAADATHRGEEEG